MKQNQTFYSFEKTKGSVGKFFLCFFSSNLTQQLIRSTAIACNLWLTEGLLLLKPLKTLEKVLQIYMVIYNN